MKIYVITWKSIYGKEHVFGDAQTLDEAIESAKRAYKEGRTENVKINVLDTKDFIYIRFEGGERNGNGMQSRD